MCHGGVGTTTAAPPKATWGNNTPSTPTNVRIGAHAKHVSGNTWSKPFACDVCHVTPADVLASGHIDEATPTAEVTFSGLAMLGGATPTWSRISATSGTCASTYCHGSPIEGGTAKAPNWTGGASQATCSSCHGAPPKDGTLIGGNPNIPGSGTPAHQFHTTKLIACFRCHTGYDSNARTADPNFHLNGARDVRVNACTLPCTIFDDTVSADVPASCTPGVDPTCVCGPTPVPAYCNVGVPGCACQIVTPPPAADGTRWNCGACHALFPPKI
jgi:predicted CxxxxCH...CXXCH cytochrome family protein